MTDRDILGVIFYAAAIGLWAIETFVLWIGPFFVCALVLILLGKTPVGFIARRVILVVFTGVLLFPIVYKTEIGIMTVIPFGSAVAVAHYKDYVFRHNALSYAHLLFIPIMVLAVYSSLRLFPNNSQQARRP